MITLDIMLPNMDGWDLLARLKESPALAGIPVVIVSIVADRVRGLALGAAAVMQKPLSRQELYGSLVELGLFPFPEGRELKVLIVDDDPVAVNLMAVRILGLAGVVRCARGGGEALALARTELPDLIVLDLMMPEMDGFAVVKALHEDPETAGIPILVVTAKELTSEERGRLDGRVATIFEKSEIDRDRFSAEILRVVAGRRMVA